MRRNFLMYATALVATSCTSQAAIEDTGAAPVHPIVAQTSSGELHGVASGNLVGFLGIPYAKPPVGELRWAPPLALETSDTVRDAKSFGPNCLQPASPFGGAETSSEDCLYLNVWAPADYRAGKADYPVLFWIHGGAYVIGSGNLSNPQAIAESGVVVVSINYRLGRLGNFAHPLLTAENPEGELGSYALLDQILALRWVQHNVAAFGGDPERVTIAGCSAGGTYSNLLMATPAARGLFNGVWAMSDPFNTPWPRLERAGVTGRSAEQLGADTIDTLGLNVDTVDDLRAVPAASLVPPLSDAGQLRIQPIVDGKILPDQALRLFKAGEIAKVPYVISASSWEGSLAMLFDVHDLYMGMLGSKDEEILAQYPAEIRENKALLTQRLMGDLAWLAPRESAVDAASAAGLSARAAHFDYVQEAKLGKVPGSMHCADERWLFADFEDPLLSGPISPADKALADRHRRYFVNFVKTGDPNGVGLPEWPEYSSERQTLIFSNSAIATKSDFPSSLLKQLQTISDAVAQSEIPN